MKPDTIPESEMAYSEDKRCTLSEMLDIIAQGKMLVTEQGEDRIYAFFSFKTPEPRPYPLDSWDTFEEAFSKGMFTTAPQGSAIEMHHIGRTLCDLMGRGNPAAGLTGRGFRGRAYAQAIKEHLMEEK